MTLILINEQERKEIGAAIEIFIAHCHDIHGGKWELFITPVMLKFIDIEEMRRLYD